MKKRRSLKTWAALFFLEGWGGGGGGNLRVNVSKEVLERSCVINLKIVFQIQFVYEVCSYIKLKSTAYVDRHL